MFEELGWDAEDGGAAATTTPKVKKMAGKKRGADGGEDMGSAKKKGKAGKGSVEKNVDVQEGAQGDNFQEDSEGEIFKEEETKKEIIV